MIASQQRAALILQVRSGQITATQAAQQLGLSRQRYYTWEKRALQAMMQALENRPKGRRSKRKPDPEKQQLQSRVKALEKELHHYKQKEKIRAELKKLESRPNRDSAKKNAR